MVVDVAEIDHVAASLCFFLLNILMVHRLQHSCQPMAPCDKIEISYEESSFAPYLLRFVPSCTENAQNQGSQSIESFQQRSKAFVIIRLDDQSVILI